MIFGAGEWGQYVELEQIEREFLLDDFDVAEDRFRRVIGEAEDVAGENGDADALPGQQHFAIFGDFVLLFLGAHQAVGINVFEPDEDTDYPGAPGLLDKTRDQVAHGVDLNHEFDIELLVLAQIDNTVENALPVGVAGEVVVGDEEAVYSLRKILAEDLFDVVGRTRAVV